MRDFVESATDDEMYRCDYMSVVNFVNQVIVVRGAKECTTVNGSKCLIAVTLADGTNTCFYTGSKHLSDVVLNSQYEFPFRVVIKVEKLGRTLGLKFYSPGTKITHEDELRLETFKARSKYN